MKTKRIIVITHGLFGVELVKSVEMIMGPQPDVKAFGLQPLESVETLFETVNDYAVKLQDEGYEPFVLVDLYGGSPSNVAMRLLKALDITILTGVSMPMLIECISMIDKETEALVSYLETIVSESVRKIDRKILFGQ